MSNKRKQIWVYEEDIARMRDEGMRLFLEEHPDMEGLNISDPFIFKRMMKFWFKE